MATVLITFDARPKSITAAPDKVALLMIDMQRDFLEQGGFGETLGNDVSLLNSAIPHCAKLLPTARDKQILVIHTREGHMPDLSDLHETKRLKSPPGQQIGDPGPMGRILVQGEPGHALIDQLKPATDELVIDKPGKGAFYNTDLQQILQARGITTLIFTGVTTEVCVSSTVREATDRGYECIVVADACASYLPDLHDAALRMITAQGGIFGQVISTDSLISSLESL